MIELNRKESYVSETDIFLAFSYNTPCRKNI